MAILNIRDTPGRVQGNFLQTGQQLKKNKFAEELTIRVSVCMRRLAEITYELIITEFSKLLPFKMFNKLYFHSLEVLHRRHDITVNTDNENRTNYVKYVLVNKGSLLHQLMEQPTQR
jgi:hypothetical protein